MKFPNMGGMGNLMAQAQKMQAELKVLQEQLAKKEFEVSSAGGRIQITINGKQEIIKMQISKDLLEAQDAELLSDMMKVAVNEAISHSQKTVANEMSRVVPPGLQGLL